MKVTGPALVIALWLTSVPSAQAHGYSLSRPGFPYFFHSSVWWNDPIIPYPVIGFPELDGFVYAVPPPLDLSAYFYRPPALPRLTPGFTYEAVGPRYLIRRPVVEFEPSPAEPYGIINDRARIRVRVPVEDARVWLQDRLTRQRGGERVFESPRLEAGAVYHYTVRATWLDKGRDVTREQIVQVRPGQEALCDFTGPVPRDLPP